MALRGVACGQIEVWEDRYTQQGRGISVFFKVFRATGTRPTDDPILVFAGGPGLPLSNLPAIYFEAWRKSREVVLIDQRDPGKSYPLACPEWTKETPETKIGEIPC